MSEGSEGSEGYQIDPRKTGGSFRINLEYFGSFRGPIFLKAVNGQILFLV